MRQLRHKKRCGKTSTVLPLLTQTQISLFRVLGTGIWLTASVQGGKNERRERSKVWGDHLSFGTNSGNRYLGYRPRRKKWQNVGGMGSVGVQMGRRPGFAQSGCVSKFIGFGHWYVVVPTSHGVSLGLAKRPAGERG